MSDLPPGVKPGQTDPPTVEAKTFSALLTVTLDVAVRVEPWAGCGNRVDAMRAIEEWMEAVRPVTLTSDRSGICVTGEVETHEYDSPPTEVT